MSGIFSDDYLEFVGRFISPNSISLLIYIGEREGVLEDNVDLERVVGDYRASRRGVVELEQKKIIERKFVNGKSMLYLKTEYKPYIPFLRELKSMHSEMLKKQFPNI